ncbi:MAG TPA: MipA/OmpV family protein [Woeseiaceae bacterium]|nr:MipA/OmpV family protein [Woeseiaceae bacterium]
MESRWQNRLVVLPSLLAASLANGSDIAEIPFFNAPPGSAALGAGLRFGQGPYFASDKDDQRNNDFVPLYLYNGKYIFFRGTAAGIHLFRNDALEFNLYSSYRFQHLDPDRHAYYEGLDEREQTLDAGIEVDFKQKWGELNFDWVTDTLDRHNGQEVSVTYRQTVDAGPWSFSPFISWTWQSDDLSNYYFGVSDAEATVARPAYLPGASQWVSVGLNTAWRASDRLVLFGNVGIGSANTAIADSPLVAKAGFSSAFVGGTYLFGNTRQPDYIIDEQRSGEWSWRVNYGYQADGNIVSEIDQGDFGKSRIADTRIAGFTLSKLLSNSERIDFLGKVAVFRHYEENEDNGTFSSYAAYIMAMGKGYSPWSGDEVFRWGFGFGMSFARHVPIAEQRKQAAKDDNTSRFLNYLEMTLDFPLRRVTRARWLQHCYTGLTLVHRSGIFGSSDFLRNVSGGSDWITVHLECTR